MSVGQGFADGINAMTGAVANAALNLSNAASTTVTNRNVIASPSGLYREFGQYIGQGFALGMDDSRALVAQSAAGMLPAQAIAAVNARTHGAVTLSGGGSSPITLTVNFYGAQQDQAVVDKIMTALGQARQMQVGM
jgi:hypothetical protein